MSALTETEAPTLDAYRRRDGVHLAVWCEHCRCWHHHGACGDVFGAGDGHRVAHCACPNAPYGEAGYVLREVGPLTTKVPNYRAIQYRARCGCPSEREKYRT